MLLLSLRQRESIVSISFQKILVVFTKQLLARPLGFHFSKPLMPLLSLRPGNSLAPLRCFVDRLQLICFLLSCYPSYEVANSFFRRFFFFLLNVCGLSGRTAVKLSLCTSIPQHLSKSSCMIDLHVGIKETFYLFREWNGKAFHGSLCAIAHGCL